VVVAFLATARDVGVALRVKLPAGVTLVPVRVLDCCGSGSWAGVIVGVDWVTGDHAAGQPAVENMSLGGVAAPTVDDAVRRSVADW
jgi:hypothetical protein